MTEGASAIEAWDAVPDNVTNIKNEIEKLEEYTNEADEMEVPRDNFVLKMTFLK